MAYAKYGKRPARSIDNLSKVIFMSIERHLLFSPVKHTWNFTLVVIVLDEGVVMFVIASTTTLQDNFLIPIFFEYDLCLKEDLLFLYLMQQDQQYYKL